MHVQMVNFTLNGLDEEGYRAACADMAPAFATIPGLLAKVWLADPDSNTYGGVYLWRDRESMEGYLASELFATVAATPQFSNITSRDFRIYDDLTAVTQPGLQILVSSAAHV